MAPGPFKPSAAPLWRVSVLFEHTHTHTHKHIHTLAIAAPAGEFKRLHLMLERVFLHLRFC